MNKLKLISSIISKLSFPHNIQYRFNNFRHNSIKKSLQPYFNYVSSNLIVKDKFNNIYNNSGIIWIFWWQGEKNIPLIVKKCIDSIKYNNPNHKIILITKYNINKYAYIPNDIYIKLFNQKVTLTHFSDILRFNILRNHGGLWIDSTMLCTSPLSDSYFSNIYTSGGYNNPDNYFVSSKWTAFLIGGCKKNTLFVFMDEFFKLYWRHNDYLIDYFLVDYGLDYAYKNNLGGFKNYVDKIAYKNNPHLHDLMPMLNKKYDKKKYLQFIKNTNLFKLSYKKNINNKQNSFYQKIVHNDLS